MGEVYIKLEDAIHAMIELYDADIERYGVEIPETFDADRAKRALGYLTWYEGLVKPVPCSECEHQVKGILHSTKDDDDNLIFYDCEKRPGGYIAPDGYCSLAEPKITR